MPAMLKLLIQPSLNVQGCFTNLLNFSNGHADSTLELSGRCVQI